MPSTLKQSSKADSILNGNILDQWSRSKTPRRKLEIYWNKAINESFFPGKESNISSEIMEKRNDPDLNAARKKTCVLQKLDNTRWFLPENIKAKINQKRELIINAKQTNHGASDADHRLSHREMTEVLRIPDDVNLGDVKATLDGSSGELYVTSSCNRSKQIDDETLCKDFCGERTLEIKVADSLNPLLMEVGSDRNMEGKVEHAGVQQNSNFVGWNAVFENFFLPIVRSYTYGNEMKNIAESETQMLHASTVMRDFVIEQLNAESMKFLNELIYSEPKTSKKAISNWDRRFIDFFRPILNYREFIYLQ